MIQLLAAALLALAPVQVTGGQIAGTQDGDVKVWKGVPFAAPPVGDLRWRSPQPVVPWQGVRTTQSFSPACAQTAAWVSEPKSEDCLYLNVWAPEGAKDLPVLVWFYGGGYYGGTASQPLYDGANLARHGAIVVTLNYRLGIFGFFAHPELAAESPHHAAGNQGIEDQIAALQWVHDNITAFGGDPNRVAIFGNSAGGESVTLLVASPAAKGLFQRGIAQSGNFALPLDASENDHFSRTNAETRAQTYAEAAGAPHLSDLRGLSVAALHKLPWYAVPSVDGYVLKEDLTTTYARHHQNDVPLMVGWTADEGKDLAPELLGTSDFTAANHTALVTKLLVHAPSPALLAAYPGATDAQAKGSINRLTNDWWGWRMVYWANLQARHGAAKSYVYHFAHLPAQETPCYYGCGIGHGAEIQYTFDNLAWSDRAWTAHDRELAVTLADTWVRFAATGAPGWTEFNGKPDTIHTITTAGDPPVAPLPDFALFQQAPADNEK
ncbi:hypothetical protein ABAC460_09505 [Asticcacaulis sp. AC460]|uniref:carboxylesterase/lipase family protein n=1 Tax=Asticcacaulis sp. AC460 TaxID=1282360 RepID=UPI0003C40447|nr:carboxylesterase family protein [Asticcacaulis sp. AC460]ESQ90380.1 hypothetical protein ABAC460_09505 [Asticcacaulis sp. AC460]